MNENWFDPNTFGAYAGALIGGGGGSLVGLWGALGGALAPRGKARGLVIGLGILLACGGAVVLGFGIYAVIVGQPYAVWYPLILGGGIITVITGSLMPLVRKRYAEADARRLAAKSLRQQ